MAQQTSLEWYIETMSNKHIGFKTYANANKEVFEQAKAMEKNQRQKDWDEGFESGAKSPEDVPLKISNTITLSNK
jgi:hypothetical protein